LAGTLVTVAKDVKIQVDFNPNKVAGYRLIGYEDRRLANKDFDNDQKDAGEIGAGHRVTALYEVIPAGKSIDATPRNDGEASKYQQKPKAEPKPADPVVGSEFASELLTLKVRYKQPEGSVSTKQEFVLNESDRDEQPQVDRDMQWATAVAEFGLLLRRSNMAPNADWSRMLERAEMATQGDAYRLECVQMMRKARSLSGNDSRQK
jgi:Ca-activated chloride channel family protein